MIERPATRDDLAAVLDLFCRYEERFRGFADSDAGDITDDWDRDDWEFARDSFVLEDHDGVVGYALASDEHADTVVDPDRYGRVLSERLLAFVEGHDRHLEHDAPDGDPATSEVLRDRGWTPARRFWRMRIAVGGPVPEPVWPAGVSVRSYARPGDDAAVHRVTTAARDIGGQHERTFDDWRGSLLDTDRFDGPLSRRRGLRRGGRRLPEPGRRRRGLRPPAAVAPAQRARAVREGRHARAGAVHAVGLALAVLVELSGNRFTTRRSSCRTLMLL